MPGEATIVPSENSVLCEGCGYMLDGLPPTGQCPECGLPIAASLADSGRVLPAWEQPDARPLTAFLNTSAAIIFRTRHFYRTLATRRNDRRALAFAKIHWTLSAILLAWALALHVHWYQTVILAPRLAAPWVIFFAGAAIIYLLMWGTTRLAARLTAWEAAYRGYRLPVSVVLRCLYYHAAHYFPVALIALLTIAANTLLLHYKFISPATASRYLLALCVEVVVAAAYLFETYWKGMKNTMYANR